jgi:hypothetical protein
LERIFGNPASQPSVNPYNVLVAVTVIMTMTFTLTLTLSLNQGRLVVYRISKADEDNRMT